MMTISTASEDFVTYYNKANLLYRSGAYTQAIEQYLSAIECDSEHFGVRYNLAGLYKNCGQFKLAIALLEPLFLEYPKIQKVAVLLYCCYMAVGDYQSACDVYWLLHPRPAVSSKDAMIYVRAVEGVGDELFYAACYLASGHEHYTIECDKRVRKLFSSAYPTIHWVDRTDSQSGSWVNNVDLFHMNLASMKGYTPTSLAVNPQLLLDIKSRYINTYDKKHRVGISTFSGGVDAVLRMPDKIFWNTLISENPHCTFFDLQQSALDLTSIESLVQLADMDLYHDFDTLSAVISSMDSVISIDNTIANLATALQVPTTVIAYPGTHWRWKMDPLIYHWFKYTKCYTQTTLGSWVSVLNTLMADLKNV